MTDAEKIAALVELLGLSEDEARAMLVDAGELADPDDPRMYDVTTNWPLPEPLEGGDR